MGMAFMLDYLRCHTGDVFVQPGQLIRNLKDYAGMKEIEAGLEALIAELSEIGDGAEADGSAGGHQKDGDSWKEEWRGRFEELKAQISAMPTYSGSGEREDGAIGILSKSQADILRSYDRNESGKKLDDILRRYIAVHNAVYAGVIYLQSPYRSLAIFALVLAYSFDLSGFVFGFVIQGRQGRGMRKSKGGNEDDTAMPPASAEVPGPGWSILETGERYLVLPGDYECRDGEYFYRVFRDGILEQWHVQDEAPYKKGIYIQERDAAKGRLAVPEQETTSGGFIQEMLFSGQPDGPRDGIYKECQLFFEEGSLYFICSGEKRFIASIDEYVPIHSYHPGKGENQTMPAKGLFKNRLLAETAVVALNVKGTRVSAVYVIEKDDVKDVVADGEDDSLISREEVVDSEEGA